MPNQPKTPTRVVRVPDELWLSALAKARAEGRTVSDVIRESLQRWVDE